MAYEQFIAIGHETLLSTVLTVTPVLLAGLVIPWIWWTARRTTSAFGQSRIRLRVVTVGLLVLAAAGLQVPTGEAPETVKIGRAHV